MIYGVAMKIEDLALFVHVAGHLSFSDAANELDLPQSSVSRKIRQMEDNLQVRLFERTSREIYLTEQGKQFYNDSKEIVDKFNCATDNLVNYQNEPQGTLTVCLLPFMAEMLSKEFFGFFMKTFPKINLVYTALKPEHLEHSFDVDLMFYIHPPKDQSMIARRIMTGTRRFYASPDYLAKQGTPEHPSELSDHNCLRFDTKVYPVDEWLYLDEGRLEAVSVNGSFTSDSINLTLELATQGQGICWVPQFLANKAVRDGHLVCLFEGKYAFEQPFYVIYRSRRHMPKKMKVFLDMLTQYIEQRYNVFNN